MALHVRAYYSHAGAEYPGRETTRGSPQEVGGGAWELPSGYCAGPFGRPGTFYGLGATKSAVRSRRALSTAVSRVYAPVTALPMETLPETFIHPAGYCQNVLSTGDCRITGYTTVGDREAIVIECDHPRTIEMAADRPDFRIRIAVDRADGVILRLEESIGGEPTRDAIVTEFEPDTNLPPSTFDFAFPTGTTMLY